MSYVYRRRRWVKPRSGGSGAKTPLQKAWTAGFRKAQRMYKRRY